MTAELSLIEVSDFLVERAQLRAAIPIQLGGTHGFDRSSISVVRPEVIAMAGCCCCCCCCNCNSGGASVHKMKVLDTLSELSSPIIVQPGPAERRSDLAPTKLGLMSSGQHATIPGEYLKLTETKLELLIDVAPTERDHFVTHTWYGPDRTMRFGGLLGSGDGQTLSSILLDGQCAGTWKVVARDVAGAIIAVIVFDLKGDTVKIIESETSPINAHVAEIRASLDVKGHTASIFSPRLNTLYFVTELDVDVPPEEIRHAWYKDGSLVEVVQPTARNGELYSRTELLGDVLGGWYAVAVDGAGRHITTASFTVRTS